MWVWGRAAKRHCSAEVEGELGGVSGGGHVENGGWNSTASDTISCNTLWILGILDEFRLDFEILTLYQTHFHHLCIEDCDTLFLV